jgi:hypothetical protein
MGTPDSGNLSLGAGEVLFARGFQSDLAKREYRHLGNVESLAITTTVETIEKKSSMDGARGVYKQAVIGSEAEVALVLSEYDPENLALALLGDTASYSQASGGPTTGQSINNGAALKFDRWYYLGYKQVTVTAVKQGANTGVLGTDYELNTELGLIKIKSGGIFTESVTTWDGSRAAIASTIVRGLSVGSIEGSLKYFSAANQAAGPRWEVEIHKVTITPDGELAFISEEFGTFTLRGKAQKDTTKLAGEQFFTALKL